jgi:hypothetical protein
MDLIVLGEGGILLRGDEDERRKDAGDGLTHEMTIS